MASDTSNVLTDRNKLKEMFLGILRNISSGIFTRQDTENQAKNLLIHYSDFWLAYAMAAMMYWYADERNNAETTLQKALALNREKTALFFSLFCVKKERMEAAELWITQFMQEQNAQQVYAGFILILNMMAAGFLSTEMANEISDTLTRWGSELAENPAVEEAQEDAWKNFMKGLIKQAALPEILHFKQLNVLPNQTNAEELLKGARIHELLLERLQHLMEAPDAGVKQEDKLEQWLEIFVTSQVSGAEWVDIHTDYSSLLTCAAQDWGDTDTFALNANAGRFIVASSARWIRNAYEDVAGEGIRKVPALIPFQVRYQFLRQNYRFEYTIRNGLDEPAVIAQFRETFAPVHKEAREAYTWIRQSVVADGLLAGVAGLVYFGGAWIFANHFLGVSVLILIIAIAILGLIGGILGGAILLAAAYYLTRFLHENMEMFAASLGAGLIIFPVVYYLKAMGNRRIIDREAQHTSDSVEDIIREAMAETADFRDYYARYTAVGRKTRQFISEMNPDNYLNLGKRIRRN